MHHCFPQVKLSDVEKDRLVERLEAQIHDFCLDNSSRSTDATDFDVNRHIVLRNFLERNHYDVDKTIDFYEAYSKWRKEMVSLGDEVNAEVENQQKLTFAKWGGTDRKGRPCCFITGDQFHPRVHRKYTDRFQKFMVETLEHGCTLAQECQSKQIGFVYDRRNLTWDNIDVHLQQKTHKCWYNLRHYYSSWFGALYIVHVNWFGWVLYLYIVKPILQLLKLSKDIIIVREAKDLLEYIDEENLPRGFLDNSLEGRGSLKHEPSFSNNAGDEMEVSLLSKASDSNNDRNRHEDF